MRSGRGGARFGFDRKIEEGLFSGRGKRAIGEGDGIAKHGRYVGDGDVLGFFGLEGFDAAGHHDIAEGAAGGNFFSASG